MHVEFNTHKKLAALLGQISHLLLSDFPHASTRTALEALEEYFKAQTKRLNNASRSPNQKLISQTCITINERIYHYLPILGFLLRSTNVRNTFEAYYSFLQIAKAMIGQDAQVIISSEWDFSPLTYPLTVSELPNYVLIGMPSSESSNALILPLAGHELGHSVWQNEQLENKYASKIEGKARQYFKDNWKGFQTAFQQPASLRPTNAQFTANSILVDALSRIVAISLSQTEETFCDALGARLFGASYAFAFHYLLAPSLGGTRSLEYPRLSVRAKNLSAFGGLNLKSLGFENYMAEFQDREPGLAPADDFILGAADNIAQQMSATMYRHAKRIATTKASKFMPDPKAQKNILKMFTHGVPARAPRSISDILNAGWEYVMLNKDTFDEKERSLVDWVSELILKSVEVLELRMRLDHA